MSINNPRKLSSSFDFLIGTWNIHNRRKNSGGVWEEFDSFSEGFRYVDGFVIIDSIQAQLPNFLLKGLTIRSYDTNQHKWFLLWFDNYFLPDFKPFSGNFANNTGIFTKSKLNENNQEVLIRFTWNKISLTEAHWKQEISTDQGQSWEPNWFMDYYRNLETD